MRPSALRQFKRPMPTPAMATATAMGCSRLSTHRRTRSGECNMLAMLIYLHKYTSRAHRSAYVCMFIHCGLDQCAPGMLYMCVHLIRFVSYAAHSLWIKYIYFNVQLGSNRSATAVEVYTNNAFERRRRRDTLTHSRTRKNNFAECRRVAGCIAFAVVCVSWARIFLPPPPSSSLHRECLVRVQSALFVQIKSIAVAKFMIITCERTHKHYAESTLSAQRLSVYGIPLTHAHIFVQCKCTHTHTHTHSRTFAGNGHNFEVHAQSGVCRACGGAHSCQPKVHIDWHFCPPCAINGFQSDFRVRSRSAKQCLSTHKLAYIHTYCTYAVCTYKQYVVHSM